MANNPWEMLPEMLMEGKGTPWGAMESGKPSDDPFAGVSQNPNDYAGFDRSALKRAMMNSLAKRGMRSQAQARAGLQRAGIRGADTSRALTDLAAQQEEGANALDAEMAYKDYQDRVAERDRALRMAQDRWAAQNAAYQQEQAQRGQFWSAMAQSLPYLAFL